MTSTARVAGRGRRDEARDTVQHRAPGPGSQGALPTLRTCTASALNAGRHHGHRSYISGISLEQEQDQRLPR